MKNEYTFPMTERLRSLILPAGLAIMVFATISLLSLTPLGKHVYRG